MLISPLLTSYLEMRLVVKPYIVVSAFRRRTSEKTAMISLVVIFGLLAVGMVLVAYGTVAKNKWGINLRTLDGVSCPLCTSPQPKLRKPRSIRQARWGGYTFAACGAEIDKWGRPEVSL